VKFSPQVVPGVALPCFLSSRGPFSPVCQLGQHRFLVPETALVAPRLLAVAGTLCHDAWIIRRLRSCDVSGLFSGRVLHTGILSVQSMLIQSIHSVHTTFTQYAKSTYGRHRPSHLVQVRGGRRCSSCRSLHAFHYLTLLVLRQAWQAVQLSLLSHCSLSPARPCAVSRRPSASHGGCGKCSVWRGRVSSFCDKAVRKLND